MDLNTLSSGIILNIFENLNFIDIYLLHQVNKRLKLKIEEFFRKNKKKIKMDNKAYIILDIVHGGNYMMEEKMYISRIHNNKVYFSRNINIQHILPEDVLYIFIRKSNTFYYPGLGNSFNILISNSYKYINKTVHQLSLENNQPFNLYYDEQFYLYDILESVYPVRFGIHEHDEHDEHDEYEHYIEYPSNDVTLMNMHLNVSDLEEYIYHPLYNDIGNDHIKYIKHLYKNAYIYR